MTWTGSPSVRRVAQRDHSANRARRASEPERSAGQQQVLYRREHPRIERGGADGGEHGPAASHAGDDDHRYVLEMVGFPLAGFEQCVVAGRGYAGHGDRPTNPGDTSGRADGECRGP